MKITTASHYDDTPIDISTGVGECRQKALDAIERNEPLIAKQWFAAAEQAALVVKALRL